MKYVIALCVLCLAVVYDSTLLSHTGTIVQESFKDLTEPEKQKIRKAVDVWRGPAPQVTPVNIQAFDRSGFPTNLEIERIANEQWPSLSPLKVELVGGGAYTGKIWRVFFMDPAKGKRTVFFFKMSKGKTDELPAWKKLRAIQKSRVGRLGYRLTHKYPEIIQFLPIITSVERFLTYTRKIGKHTIDYTIEVIHAAQGSSAYDLVSSKIPLSDAERDMRAKVIGRALGAFHRSFLNNEHLPIEEWKTVIHRDFHPVNVFIKKFPATLLPEHLVQGKKGKKVNEFSRVYFIDNETIHSTLGSEKNLKKPYLDLFMFVFHPILYWDLLNENIWSDTQWKGALRFFSEFFRGYVEAFPYRQRVQLDRYIKDMVRYRCYAAKHYLDFKLSNSKSIKSVEDLTDKIYKSIISDKVPIDDRAGSWLERGSWNGYAKLILNTNDLEVFGTITKRLREVQNTLGGKGPLQDGLVIMQSTLTELREKLLVLHKKLEHLSHMVSSSK